MVGKTNECGKEFAAQNFGGHLIGILISIILSTILYDWETVVNSRPLTYIDIEDMSPLSPVMFMPGLSTNDTPDLDKLDHENLNIRFKYLQ